MGWAGEEAMPRTRAYRRHQAARVIAARRRFLREDWDAPHLLDQPPGRWRKRHPGDCGRARCGLCHGDKLFGPKARGAAKRAAIAAQL